MKYLDLQGVQYLWNKIKNYIAQKFVICTQEEYDQLQTKGSDVLYFIKDTEGA